jgi:hypothetical protein
MAADGAAKRLRFDADLGPSIAALERVGQRLHV